MSATFFSGKVTINNTKTGTPSAYYQNIPATCPPYDVSSNAADGKFVNKTVFQYSQGNIVRDNTDCPCLWFIKNHTYQEPWVTIAQNNDGQYHNLLTLTNGNYIQIRYDSSVPQFKTRFYLSNNTLISEMNLFQGFNAAVTYTGSCTDVYMAVFDDGSSLFGGLVTLESSTHMYISVLLRNNASSGYNRVNELFFDNAAAPVYAWSPFEQLNGNNGTFSMNLSQIDDEAIGEATPEVVTSDGTIFSLSINSLLRRIGANLQEGVETKVIYCGDNYATATRRTGEGVGTNIVYITLKFYFRSGLLAFTAPENIAYYEGGSVVSPEVYLSIIYDDTEQVASVDYITYTPSTGNYKYNLDALQNETQLYQLWVWLQDNGQVHSSSPYDTGSTDTGGEAGTPRTQDDITISQAPTLGGLDLGIVTLYKPSDTQMASISQFLWSDNVLDNFKKYFNNFADNILSFYVLPYTPTGCPSKTFKVGNMTSEITAVDYVTSRFIDIPMGSVQILPRWGSYLDFAPYTKIEVYLPYIGNHSLDTDELMCPAYGDGTLPTELGSTLDLTYRIDMLTGVIVAFIKVNGRLMYQFTGKVGINIPLTGQTFASLVQGIVQAGAGLATTIATGGLTAPLSAAAAVSGTVNATKPSVERIGNISGDNSMLATKSPYIVISSPNKHYVDAQEDFTGFPSYMTGTLSSFSGYTEVVEAHVEGISCTEEERSKILTWLKEGVIL